MIGVAGYLEMYAAWACTFCPIRVMRADRRLEAVMRGMMFVGGVIVWLESGCDCRPVKLP